MIIESKIYVVRPDGEQCLIGEITSPIILEERVLYGDGCLQPDGIKLSNESTIETLEKELGALKFKLLELVNVNRAGAISFKLNH